MMLALADNIDIERASYIRQCVEAVLLLTAAPRTRIQIVVQVLADGGSVLACALNAATLALLDAGVPTTSLLAAVTVAVRDVDHVLGPSTNGTAHTNSKRASSSQPQQQFELLLDPVGEETQSASLASVTVAFGSTSAGTILSVVETGMLDEQAYFDSLQLGRAAAAHIQAFMKISLERKNRGEQDAPPPAQDDTAMTDTPASNAPPQPSSM
jgi:exosome complex component RRP46